MNRQNYRFLKNTPLPNIIIICSAIQLLLILGAIFINIESNSIVVFLIEWIFCIAFDIYTIYLVVNRQKIIVNEFSICFIFNVIVAGLSIYTFADAYIYDFVLTMSILNFGVAICSIVLFIKKLGKAQLCILMVLQIAIDIISAVYVLIFTYHYKGDKYEEITYLFGILIMHFIFLLFLFAIGNNPNREYISPLISANKCLHRRKIGLCIILSILSCGIYYIYWNYKIVKDMRKLNRQSGGIGEFLLITFVPFYDWYWVCSRGNKLTVIAQNNRIRPTGSGIAYLVLDIFFLKLVTMSLMQDTLNNLSAVMDENFVYGDIVQTNNYAPYMQPAPYAQTVQGMQQPPVQSTMQNTMQNNIEILKQLNELKNQGIITEEEFIQKKEQLMK